MKKTDRKKEIASTAALIILFLLLVGLTYSLFYMRNLTNRGDGVPFDLAMLTADRDADMTDISQYLLPEFIGITAAGDRCGLSGSVNTADEIYGSLAPIISETMQEKYITESDSEKWESYIGAEGSVYIRYHSTLPDNVISLFADASSSANVTADRGKVSSYVREMFIIPCSGSDNRIEIAVKDTDGSVFLYRKPYPMNMITSEDLAEIISSYRSSMTKFMFSEDSFHSASPTEPVFLNSLFPRNILITGHTAMLIWNSDSELDGLMRVFGINPDKLLNTHITDDEDEGRYIDTHGVLYIGESEFEYSATSEGGVDISDIIGYTDSVSLAEYIRAAISIYEDIRDINIYFTGRDADIAISNVYTDNGVLTLEFSYFFDNIKITGIEPALVVSFSKDRLTYAKLYTIAARNLGDRTESLTEWWYLEHIANYGITPINTSLVYKSDFLSESISAEWAASAESRSSEQSTTEDGR